MLGQIKNKNVEVYHDIYSNFLIYTYLPTYALNIFNNELNS